LQAEEAVMRGVDHQQSGMFSYISAERRVPKDHPLRAIRVMVDAALKESSWRFDAVYAISGRPSIPPEKLLRALLLQMLYTVRSERLLMEQLDYNFLFRSLCGPGALQDRWSILYDGHNFCEFRSPLVAIGRAHGAGCTLSAAIAAALARGESLEGAIGAAKRYVTLALQNAPRIGHGSRPLNHSVAASLTYPKKL
jgi:transposase